MGIIMEIAAIVLMVRVASMEGRNPLVWGLVTLGLVELCAYLIPFPLLNIAIGAGVSFGAMIVCKIIQDRPRRA